MVQQFLQTITKDNILCCIIKVLDEFHTFVSQISIRTVVALRKIRYTGARSQVWFPHSTENKTKLVKKHSIFNNRPYFADFKPCSHNIPVTSASLMV